MSRSAVSIGRIFGIQIDLDSSWFLVFGLATWVLSASYFPLEFPGWSGTTYWIAGAVTAVLLFASVLLHEIGHAVVALHFGVPVRRITLLIFGGISQLSGEPAGAWPEFWIAFAGPLVSLALALLCWELQPLVTGTAVVLAVLQYLATLNVMLTVFNLVPGFPLDGGRVLRAVVWAITRNAHRATSIAAMSGETFGFLFIVGGVWLALSGALLNGLWIAFIGWFIESGARSQLQSQELRSLLAGHHVSEIMKHEVESVPGRTSLQEFVDRYVLKTGRRAFVVNAESGATGLITLAAVRHVPRDEWPVTTVERVMVPADRIVSVPEDADAWSALELMGRDGVNQVPVVRQNGIVGILSRDDLLQYLGLAESLAH